MVSGGRKKKKKRKEKQERAWIKNVKDPQPSLIFINVPSKRFPPPLVESIACCCDG